MKKLVMVVLGVVVFSSGFSQEIKSTKRGVIDPDFFGVGRNIYEIQIDSCEYLVIRGSQSGNVLTHKENCSRCEKIRQREHRELIEAIRSLRSVEAKRK